MLFLLCVVVFAAVVGVIVFGDSPGARNTWVHVLYRGMVTCSSRMSAFLQSHPGVYTSLRWTVPLFYVVVMSTCIGLFYLHVYAAVPAYHTLFIATIIGYVVVATELVIFTDPGTVTPACVQDDLLRFPPNGLIFWDKLCSTCQLQKPARSKHCSSCNKCISLYDHHCIWLNNCIGERNYRYFLHYLASNVLLMVYGAVLCYGVLRLSGSGLWYTITRTTQSNKIAGILMILGAIFSVITAAFAGLHLRYIYLGVTTNEADKWGEIEHLVNLGVLYYMPDKGIYLEKSMMKQGTSYTPVYISLKDETVVLEGNQDAELQPVRCMQDVPNIYDRGFYANFRQRVSIPRI